MVNNIHHYIAGLIRKQVQWESEGFGICYQRKREGNGVTKCGRERAFWLWTKREEIENRSERVREHKEERLGERERRESERTHVNFSKKDNLCPWQVQVMQGILTDWYVKYQTSWLNLKKNSNINDHIDA